MPILVTGFTPFGGAQINPSQQIIEHLAQHRPDIHARVLPTEYHASAEMLVKAIDDAQPDAVIMIGVAETRSTISLERIAINVDDAAIPDNAGLLKDGQPIDPDGAAAYWSTLPLDAMRDAVQMRGIPVSISNHAGTYVCNHVFYTARRMLEHTGRNIPCGFIHVPALIETAPTGMPLAQMIEAIEACIGVLKKPVR